MGYEELKAIGVEVRDRIAWVRMTFHTSDPEYLFVQHTEIAGLWERLDRDRDVRAVVITGPGDEFYLSGAPGAVPKDAAFDTAEAVRNFTMPELMGGEVTKIIHDMIRFEKPVVAAINGPASGAGLCIALLSDISVMAEDAWLCDPHILLGISTGDGPGCIWPLHTGIAKAKLYLMTSDAVSGTEADRIGLISRAVPRDQVMPVATDYATRFAASPEITLRFTKRSINQWLRQAEVIALDHASTLEALSMYAGEVRPEPYFEWPPRLVP